MDLWIVDPNFVDPVTQPSSSRTEVYPFDSKFLPYVKESTAILGGDPLASLYTTRELKVNVRVNGITEGCGTYNNVSVDFIGSFKVVNSNDYKATVGGYVGCVVNGGLIFRNVDDDNLTTTTVTPVNNVENRTSVQGFKVIKVNGNGVQQDVKIGDNVICSSSVDGSMLNMA